MFFPRIKRVNLYLHNKARKQINYYIDILHCVSSTGMQTTYWIPATKIIK